MPTDTRDASSSSKRRGALRDAISSLSPVRLDQGIQPCVNFVGSDSPQNNKFLFECDIYLNVNPLEISWYLFLIIRRNFEGGTSIAVRGNYFFFHERDWNISDPTYKGNHAFYRADISDIFVTRPATKAFVFIAKFTRCPPRIFIEKLGTKVDTESRYSMGRWRSARLTQLTRWQWWWWPVGEPLKA